MKVPRLLFAIFALILVVSLLSIWFSPTLQDYMAANTMWNGLNDFSEEFSAEQIDSLDNLPDLPDKSVLVAIPYLEYNDEDLNNVKQFVDDGGTLLLMDDYGFGNDILEYLGVTVRFSGKPLLDPLFNYKNQSMPRITDFNPAMIESGVDVIMLNHATALTNVKESAATAWSSEASFLDVNGNDNWEEDEPTGPFAVTAELRFGKGTIILVSDPSIIINIMVGMDKNFDFIDYLTGNHGDEKEILVDRSHLSKTPLDVSKTRLIDAREALEDPNAIIGINAVLFIVVSRFLLKKEKSNG